VGVDGSGRVRNGHGHRDEVGLSANI